MAETKKNGILLDFWVSVKAAPHECIIRTGQPSWKWGVFLLESNCIILRHYMYLSSVRGSRNFRQGGGGVQVRLKKSSDNLFFFLVLNLFYRSQMVNFKEIYHFSRFQHFSGGYNFFRGGSNCLFPIEIHIICDFPGGGGPDPLSPLWIRTWVEMKITLRVFSP